jgi:hypothetical protein
VPSSASQLYATGQSDSCAFHEEVLLRYLFSVPVVETRDQPGVDERLCLEPFEVVSPVFWSQQNEIQKAYQYQPLPNSDVEEYVFPSDVRILYEALLETSLLHPAWDLKTLVSRMEILF